VNNGSFGHVLSRLSAQLLPLSRQHCTEPVEAAFPQGATLRNPTLRDLQASGLDATHAHSAYLGRSNQTAFFEHLEVLHNGCEGNVQGFSKVLGGSRRAAELVHDCASRWISKSMEHSAHRGLVKHRLKYFLVLKHSQV
jgi:hypothetical protein